MSNSNPPRITGVAGIVSAVSMLAYVFTVDQTTFMPSSPLFYVFSLITFLAGIVLTVGLYLMYRQDVATLSLVTAAVSVLGYLLFALVLVTRWNPDSPMIPVADILVYVVGVPLFSWLGYSTRKMPRPLSMVGFLAGLAGLVSYVGRFVFGAGPTQPNHPLAGAMMVFGFLYLILVVVWLAWTGYALLSRKQRLATA